MMHVCDTVNDRITHIDVRGSHVNAGSQDLLAVRIFSRLHILKHLQILFHGALSAGIVLSRLREGASVLLDLLRGEIGDICLSLFNQFYSRLIHLSEIVRREEKPVLPVSAKPLDVRLDGLYKLDILLCRVGIIKTHIELAVVLLCQSVIQKNALGVSDVQIAVRLRWKPGMHGIIDTLSQILVNNHLDKIL